MADQVDQLLPALEKELERRLAKANPFRRNSDPAVKECRAAIHAAGFFSSHMIRALAGKSDESPLVLLDPLFPDCETLEH